jgi:hypothetical protein
MVGTPGEIWLPDTSKYFTVDGSLLNLLDSIADSQSTEVPYRVGGKPIQSLLCLWLLFH